MPPSNPILRAVHRAVSEMPPLLNTYRHVRDFAKRDPLITASYRKLFERGRLTLPTIEPETIAPAAHTIAFPALYPLFAGEDAPLADLLLLLNAAKGRHARRILEVGTYRARTTYALHLNCPEAKVVSYDIQLLESPYRQQLQGVGQVELRHASFATSAESLRKEAPFDLIFVDGSHQFQHVIDDSRLALQLVAAGGIVIWHDYRPNDYFNKELRVPEALSVVRQNCPIFAVLGTTCAVHLKKQD